jgi:transcription initiation factor IIE alpha subunit
VKAFFDTCYGLEYTCPQCGTELICADGLSKCQHAGKRFKRPTIELEELK